MFLASAFGLQVAAQLAYGAPAHGCHRHRASERRRGDERSPLFRSNTIQYGGPVANSGAQRHIHNTTDSSTQQRKHQSVYEASCRKYDPYITYIT